MTLARGSKTKQGSGSKCESFRLIHEKVSSRDDSRLFIVALPDAFHYLITLSAHSTLLT